MAALLLALALPAVRAATPGVDEPPAPGPAREVKVPPLHEQRLANGLRVVVAPRDGLPLVSATLLVRAGAERDPAGHAGLAELTAQLLTKGVRRRDGRVLDATALARAAEALGGALEADSGWQMTSVSMTVSTPRLAAALALVADVARRPLLASAELDRLREQMLDELRVELSSPGPIAQRVARRLHWGAGAYGAIGTPASLQRIGVADARAFHRRAFRPGQALLVLAGDLTPAQGLALAQRHFGDWRGDGDRGEEPSRAHAVTPLPARTVLVDMPGAGQSAVAVVGPWAALGARDRRIAQVAATLLGGGYSARLNQEVRIKRGLSYGVATDTEAQPEGGMLLAQAQTRHDAAPQVLAVMRQQIARIAAEPAGDEELAARKATLVGGFARRLETNAGLAALIAAQWRQQRPLDELHGYVAEVLAVTPQQVRDFAAAHWRADALRGVVVGDLGAAGMKTAPPDEDGVRRIALPALDFDAPGLGAR